MSELRPWPATESRLSAASLVPFAGPRPSASSAEVVRLDLAGYLSKSTTIPVRDRIRRAANDPSVGGILLVIDSPGGQHAGTAELANDVLAARKQKPVWAFVEDLAAGSAYWIASQAGQIFANTPTALVGSIGTYQLVYDMSASAEKEGVKAFPFATGPLKAAGLPGTEVTPEQQRYFQRLVDGQQATFDDAVRKGRGLTDQELAVVKSGAVYPAKEALRLRLIDGIRSFEATVDALEKAARARVRGGSSMARFEVPAVAIAPAPPPVASYEIELVLLSGAPFPSREDGRLRHIDVANVEVSRTGAPVLWHHDQARRYGHLTRIWTDGVRLFGRASLTDARLARGIYGVSVGITSFNRPAVVGETVNGFEVPAGALVGVKAIVHEVSLVELGQQADPGAKSWPVSLF